MASGLTVIDAVDATLPLLARRVAVQLDLVAVGIRGVEAPAHAVVGRSPQQPALGEHGVRPLHGVPVGQLDGDVVEADGGRDR